MGGSNMSKSSSSRERVGRGVERHEKRAAFVGDLDALLRGASNGLHEVAHDLELSLAGDSAGSKSNSIPGAWK
jgi:hypothetical protein